MSVYERLNEQQQFAARVIADHARATAFAIADGILPGNEGRNYVLRKIMRRAIYHGREHLGLSDAFFYKVCDKVVDDFSGAFPELETQRDFIGKMVRLEEERFGNTLSNGLEAMKDFLAELRKRRSEEMDLLRAALEGNVNLDDYHDKVSVIETKYPKVSKLSDVAEIVYRERLPLDLVIIYLREKVSLFRPDEDFLKLEPLFFIELLKVIRKHRDDDAFKILTSTSDENRWRDLDKYWENERAAYELTKIYDTRGLPRDLIVVALEQEFKPNADELIELFDNTFEINLSEIQGQHGIGKTERKSQVSPMYLELAEKLGANEFLGYETTRVDAAKVVAILDGDVQVDSLGEGKQGSVVLDRTPFYAESGGQVGDVGVIVGTAYGSGRLNTGDVDVKPPATAGGSDLRAAVHDTYSPVAGLIIHKVTVEKSSISVGDTVSAIVDESKRDATRRNHTATHLVHAALKEVLGTHVKQAGSVVAPNYLRFDFTHYQPMNDAEIAEVEDLVNRYILQNEPVTTNMMALEDAMRSGAVAMFGEKYGSDVRVLSVGDGKFSMELCGGTHVRATGDIGSFKITSDEAIASGVRRIRAITGFDAFERFRADEKLIDASLAALNTQRDNLPNAIAKLQEELKRTRKEMDDLKLKAAMGGGSSANGESDDVKEIGGVKVLAKIVEGLDAGATRQLSDTLLARLKSGVVIIGRKDEDKVGLIVRVSDDLTGKVRAGDIIREIAPIVGGKGGGKADMAEGGGTEPAKLSEAIDAAFAIVERSFT